MWEQQRACRASRLPLCAGGLRPPPLVSSHARATSRTWTLVFSIKSVLSLCLWCRACCTFLRVSRKRSPAAALPPVNMAGAARPRALPTQRGRDASARVGLVAAAAFGESVHASAGAAHWAWKLGGGDEEAKAACEDCFRSETADPSSRTKSRQTQYCAPTMRTTHTAKLRALVLQVLLLLSVATSPPVAEGLQRIVAFSTIQSVCADGRGGPLRGSQVRNVVAAYQSEPGVITISCLSGRVAVLGNFLQDCLDSNSIFYETRYSFSCQQYQCIATYDVYCVQFLTFEPCKDMSSSATSCVVSGSGYVQNTRSPSPPTLSPTLPTAQPTRTPTRAPSAGPTRNPTKRPTSSPTMRPTASPSKNPTRHPSATPSHTPTRGPTRSPSVAPSSVPTNIPTRSPLGRDESVAPSQIPTRAPSRGPSPSPSKVPSRTSAPAGSPNLGPVTEAPMTPSPTVEAPTTASPSVDVSQDPGQGAPSPPSGNAANATEVLMSPEQYQKNVVGLAAYFAAVAVFCMFIMAPEMKEARKREQAGHSVQWSKAVLCAAVTMAPGELILEGLDLLTDILFLGSVVHLSPQLGAIIWFLSATTVMSASLYVYKFRMGLLFASLSVGLWEKERMLVRFHVLGLLVEDIPELVMLALLGSLDSMTLEGILSATLSSLVLIYRGFQTYVDYTRIREEGLPIMTITAPLQVPSPSAERKAAERGP